MVGTDHDDSDEDAAHDVVDGVLHQLVDHLEARDAVGAWRCRLWRCRLFNGSEPVVE